MEIKRNIAISDNGFVFDPTTGDSYSVNPIGLEIIQMLKDGKEEKEIKKYLTEQYLADNDTIEKDLYDFNIQLQNFKLMQHG
jgi:coenzyme PQQ synthesis protein D (PqqD)